MACRRAEGNNKDACAWPGSNATGFIQFEYGLSGKWLELLKEIAPRVTRAAVLRDPAITAGIGQWGANQTAAPSLGIEVSPVTVLSVTLHITRLSSATGQAGGRGEFLPERNNGRPILFAAQKKWRETWPARLGSLWLDKIDPRSRDKDGAWIAVNQNPIFYGYNTEQVQQNAVPRLATEFLRPLFKGKLITAYPADDDASLFAFATIVQKYGWGYMTQYMKQQPKFVQGHLGVAHSIGSGESLASFDTTVSSALDVQHAGGKIALAGPTDDYLPIFFTAEAILKDAPHPNAAKLFVTWFLSKEWQSRTGVYSSRSDVPPPAGLPQLSSYRLEERYAEFVSSENQVADLRKRFESYTGPVTNAGGVR
jgi:ABC-type Fe3+ transport system substrate-binding protein